MRIGQLIKRAAKSLKAPSRELSHGYRNATEVTEARIAQIVAQSPSDRSSLVPTKFVNALTVPMYVV